MENTTISLKSTMRELLDWYPGAKRVLFQRWHIGGCGSCGFDDSQTFEAVLKGRGVPDEEAQTAVAQLEKSRRLETELTIAAHELETRLQKGLKVVDLRPENERRMGAIEGSVPATQELVDEIFDKWPKDAAFVLVCHKGDHSLAAALNLTEQGFTGVRALKGGIDAWSAEIDPLLPRY